MCSHVLHSTFSTTHLSPLLTCILQSAALQEAHPAGCQSPPPRALMPKVFSTSLMCLSRNHTLFRCYFKITLTFNTVKVVQFPGCDAVYQAAVSNAQILLNAIIVISHLGAWHSYNLSVTVVFKSTNLLL